MGLKMPSELEFVSDFQAQENFRQSFRRQLDRCLILMIQEPTGGFDLALAGLDTLLDYYKDGIYLDDMDELSERYKNKKGELQASKRKGVNIKKREENIRFDLNRERFRILMRLAGRSSFLPFPPVAVAVGGRDPTLDYTKIDIDSEQIEDSTRQIEDIVSKKLEKEEKSVSELSSKNINEDEKENDSIA